MNFQLFSSTVGSAPVLNQPSLCRLKLPLAWMSRLSAEIVPVTLMLPSVLTTETLPSGLTTAPSRFRSTGALPTSAIISASSAPPNGSAAQPFFSCNTRTSATSEPVAP